jgi:hypothetical protein
MLPVLVGIVGIVAVCAIAGGLALILSLTVPRMARNKVYLFFLWFALLLPFGFVTNFVFVLTLGYHRIGWTGAIIISFFVAICGTFFGPTQPHDFNTPPGSRSR